MTRYKASSTKRFFTFCFLSLPLSLLNLNLKCYCYWYYYHYQCFAGTTTLTYIPRSRNSHCRLLALTFREAGWHNKKPTSLASCTAQRHCAVPAQFRLHPLSANMMECTEHRRKEGRDEHMASAWLPLDQHKYGGRSERRRVQWKDEECSSPSSLCFSNRKSPPCSPT